MRNKSLKTSPEQSARFREAAKNVEGGDEAAFERVFKKIVTRQVVRKQPSKKK